MSYVEIFERERLVEYPRVIDYEREMGYEVERSRLEKAARVLACPLKNNPPNWQHGRVIYATLRSLIGKTKRASDPEPVRCLDIGTAKGFSALCAQWAVTDSGCRGVVTSVDVINPHARELRNTVAEVDGPRTLAETLEPWPESQRIKFVCAQSVNWLSLNRLPIDFAFVDGKHRGDVVSQELELLARWQRPGAIAMLDDVHVPSVRHAAESSDDYEVRYLEALPNRVYGIARRI